MTTKLVECNTAILQQDEQLSALTARLLNLREESQWQIEAATAEAESCVIPCQPLRNADQCIALGLTDLPRAQGDAPGRRSRSIYWGGRRKVKALCPASTSCLKLTKTAPLRTVFRLTETAALVTSCRHDQATCEGSPKVDVVTVRHDQTFRMVSQENPHPSKLREPMENRNAMQFKAL